MAQRSPTTEYRYPRIDQIESVEGQELGSIAEKDKNIVSCGLDCYLNIIMTELMLKSSGFTM